MRNKLIGIFVEPRKIKQIFYSIKNFYQVLPNTPLYFFCGKNLKEFFLLKLSNYTNLIIIELDVNNLNMISYSNLFKSLNFWEQFDADYALTIQTDGCLCLNSKYKITSFYKYDYVGGYAPENWWKKEVGNLNCKMCFNGGFSLRNINKCKNVIKEFIPQPTKKYYKSIKLEEYAEDLYFVKAMLKLKYNVGIDTNATTFCTHTKYINNTFAVHKLHHYQKNINDFLKYCPEFKDFIKLELIDVT